MYREKERDGFEIGYYCMSLIFYLCILWEVLVNDGKIIAPNSHHTIIKAFAMPINIDIMYMKALMLLGKRRIPAPQNIQIIAPAE